MEGIAHSTSIGEFGDITLSGIDIGFVLSDDKPLPEDVLRENMSLRSLGDTWLQGHMAIAVCHFLLDQGASLNLTQS
jgi:hypothetical protein